MDMSRYKIRVIRTEAKDLNGVPIAASSQLPIDIEGSLLSISCIGSAAKEALLAEDWFKIFFGGLSIYVKVRWDNDYKCSLPITTLVICSFGTLPMCWPIYAPSKAELSHRFDNRRAEERRPRTLPVNIKDCLFKKEPIKLIDIDFTSIEEKYNGYKLKEASTSNLKLKKFAKGFSTGDKIVTYSMLDKYTNLYNTYA